MNTIVILNKYGEVVRSSHKWDRDKEEDIQSLRNSLQAYWDKFWPDLGYRAQIRSDDPSPFQISVIHYNVFNGTGLWMGEYLEADAQQLIDLHDDWTMVEVGK